MSDRREFRRDVRVAILKRATVNGVVMCEAINAGVRCACTKGLALHHDEMDAMEVDKTSKLTAEDGRMLCKDHHDPITKKQRKDLSRVQKAEARHLGDKDPRVIKIPQPPKADRSTSKLDQIRALPRRWESDESFISIGDVASGVLAKITPKKDAAE